MSRESKKESPFKTEISRQAKAKRKDKRGMYVEIKPKIFPGGVFNVKLVTMMEEPEGYDIFDGTSHFRGESVNDMFLDFTTLMEKYNDVLVISYDAWHHSDIAMEVILNSYSLRPNHAKIEPSIPGCFCN